jgi:hypothetical protein
MSSYLFYEVFSIERDEAISKTWIEYHCILDLEYFALSEELQTLTEHFQSHFQAN